MSNKILVSEGGKLILNTIQKELFPIINGLSGLLVKVQKFRVRFPLYSPELAKLDKEYQELSAKFFEVDRKLKTPDILFKGLDKIHESAAIADYFSYKNAFSKNLEMASKYVEIIDRVLDRKTQGIQNFWTFFLALAAIVVSIIWH